MATECYACHALGTFTRWGTFCLCGDCAGNLRKNRIMLLEELRGEGRGEGRRVRVLRWKPGSWEDTSPWEEKMSWREFLLLLQKEE